MNDRLTPILKLCLCWTLGVFLASGFPSSVFSESLSKEAIVESWSQGYGELSEEEKELFGKMAQRKLDMAPTKGIFPPPGESSSIMTNPILVDYAQLMKIKNQDMPPKAQALMEQTQSRFLLLETGLSIEKTRWESIDLLKFMLTYSPNHVATYSLLPERKSRTLIKIGGETKVNIGGNLNFGVGKQLKKGVEAKANADGKQEFWLEWKGNYDIETVDIATKGRNQPWSRWTFVAEDLIRDDLSFFVVLRVPEEVEQFDVTVDATFIDKRFYNLEKSKTNKSLVYNCRVEPVGCQTKD